jgi:hypothetical protein
MTHSRRTVIKFISATTIGGIGLSTTRVAEAGNHGDNGNGNGGKKKGDIRLMGYSLLSDPAGGYAEDIRSDGQYALMGSFTGPGGSFLVDISDPTDPTATDQFETDLQADQADGAGFVGEPPMAWGVNYADERDFTVVSDMQTGIYVLKFTPNAAKEA